MTELKTPLVNLLDVQEFCGLSRNITEKEYNRFILTAQNTVLREELGEDLVDALVNLGTDVNLEMLLDDFVKPFLSHESFVHYSMQSSMKSTKSGIKRMEGENTESGSRGEYSSVSSLHQKNADAYLKRTICFLEDNIDNFPLYTSKKQPVAKRSIFTSKG